MVQKNIIDLLNNLLIKIGKCKMDLLCIKALSVLFDTQKQRNQLHLSSADCEQTNQPVCAQIAGPAVINHNYRVGLAHRSSINTPPPHALGHLPVLLGVARPPFGGQNTAGDNGCIIYPGPPPPPFY